MAQYPGTIANQSGSPFTAPKTDGSTIILAQHVTSLEAEVIAIQTTLGINPQSASSSVGARIATIESTYSLNSHTHTTLSNLTVNTGAIGNVSMTLQGISGQTADFLQFKTFGAVTVAKVDVGGNVTTVTVKQTGMASTPAALAVGNSGAAGSGPGVPNLDHGHAVPVGTPVAATGSSLAAGGSGQFADAVHVHTGGIGVFSGAGAYPGSPYTGQFIYDPSLAPTGSTKTGFPLVWNGAAWRTPAPIAVGSTFRTATSNAVNTVTSTGSFVQTVQVSGPAFFAFIVPAGYANSIVTISGSAYITAGAGLVFFSLNGVTTKHQFFYNNINFQMPITFSVDGLSAGTYGIYVQVSSGITWQTDPNDSWSYSLLLQ